MSSDKDVEESLPGDLSLALGDMAVQDHETTPPRDAEAKQDKSKTRCSHNITLLGQQSDPLDWYRIPPTVDILLKATGNAPIMKKKKWTVAAEKPVSWVVWFVKKYLKLEPEERLFLYVNQTFAPSPDQTIRNLYECFGTDGKLVLHYCKSQAWG